MTTPNRGYTELTPWQAPDVPFHVNRTFNQIDTDVQAVADAGQQTAIAATQANTTAGSAVAIAEGAVAIAEGAVADVDEIKGPIDTRLTAVETAAGYAPGDATDAAMTNIATQEDTQFRAALNAQTAALIDPVVQDVRATYAPRRANLLASIGDSMTWRNKMKIYSNTSTASSVGWLHWANAELGQRITEHGNMAVSGKRTDEMVSEQLPAVLALDPAPGYCTVFGGANDVVQVRTAAQTQADLATLYDALESQGIGIIAATVTPQTGLTADQKNNIYRINLWIKEQAAVRRDFILVDWHAAMSDANGDPKPGVLVDNVHQSVKGAAIMGHVFAETIRPFLPAVDVLPMPGDFRNRHVNPFKAMPGNGVGPDAAQTPDVAFEHRVATADASTLDAVLSLVPRTDGIPGNWQGIEVISGNARETNLSLIPASDGDKLQATVELDIDPEVAAGGVTRIALILEQSGGSPFKVASYLDRDPDIDDGIGEVIPITPGRMVLRTPPVVLGTGVSGVYSHVRIYGSTNGGQVRIGRRSVMRVV